MADEIIAYLMENDLDPDVFFTGSGGPIAPEMRSNWIADHEEATAHTDIEYDDSTGFYSFSLRVPDESAQNYLDNRETFERKYANHDQMNIVYSSAGIYIVGSVQNPGTACMMAGMVEDAPSMFTSSSR